MIQITLSPDPPFLTITLPYHTTLRANKMHEDTEHMQAINLNTQK